MASTALTVAAFVLIAVVATVLFAQDPYNPTGAYVNNFPADSSSTYPMNGLSLKLSINATTITSGESVNVTAGEYNTLPRTNNVTASRDWPPVKGLGIGICGTLNEPFGMAVFRGYYTTSSVRTASPLMRYEPNELVNCPMILSGIASYSFYPNSPNAQISGSCTPNPCLEGAIKASFEVNGFWNTVPIAGQSYHAELTPGVYTVAAGDEWGHLLLLYFVVNA